MLKNFESKRVKFVSYNGKWPCLCTGTLILKIDDELVRFGMQEKYPSFWSSGGECGFMGDYTDAYINEGEWIINTEDLPDKYKKYVTEIDIVFNENVPHGCCGGCL